MLRSTKTRACFCWILLVGGAAALGCGGSENQSGAPSASDAGATDGGSGSGVGGGATSGGSGGTAVGGGPASGGAGGSGGAVVPNPAGPGIACGETTCAEGTQMCCVGESDPWCDEYQCANAIARLECDDSVDCPGERCCYTNISAMNWIVTRCGSDCDAYGDLQVCKEAGDCDNGDSCHVFVCGGLDTRNVAIGLCTASAPENCE